MSNSLSYTSFYGAPILNLDPSDDRFIVDEWEAEDDGYDIQFIIWRHPGYCGEQVYFTCNRSQVFSSVHDGTVLRHHSDPEVHALLEEVAENHGLQLGELNHYYLFVDAGPIDWTDGRVEAFLREALGCDDAMIAAMKASD